ncbi:uncharacterized protein A4U43_C07F1690 [Asparagus officinalis]|uniref:Uncharacterized protein n=1 Tax=Asparagus officinalis TaxID=4686 RepID=A0A5P1E8P9_ASPOF|nr:uncharacterized protein A4U43_C07F1690 [Asparagus officinalis]
MRRVPGADLAVRAAGGRGGGRAVIGMVEWGGGEEFDELSEDTHTLLVWCGGEGLYEPLSGLLISARLRVVLPSVVLFA